MFQVSPHTLGDQYSLYSRTESNDAFEVNIWSSVSLMDPLLHFAESNDPNKMEVSTLSF